jgi:hypothetical protein
MERIRSQGITHTEEPIRNFNDAEMALTRALIRVSRTDKSREGWTVRAEGHP